MRNNFHYGFGTRLIAVVLTLLMMLSAGGFFLRDGGMGTDGPTYDGMPTDTPAPSDSPSPSDTPAPSDEPEATEVPAATADPAATAAPEATEAPSTETDSETDTNTNASEPGATSDPQDTPAPDTEATTAPEGDPAGDEPQEDVPVTIADVTGKLKISLTKEENSFTLTIENVSIASFNKTPDFEIEFVQNPSISGFSTDYWQPSDLTVAGGKEDWEVEHEQNGASKNRIKFTKTSDAKFSIGDKLTITFTDSGDQFNKGLCIKLNNAFFGSSVYIEFKPASDGSGVTHQVSSEGVGHIQFDGSTTPGGGGGGSPKPSDGLTFEKTYNIVYHLNAPGTEEGTVQNGENVYVVGGDTPTIALSSALYTMFGGFKDYYKNGNLKADLENTRYYKDNDSDGSHFYYFAGWGTAEQKAQSGDSFADYGAVEYPATLVPGTHGFVDGASAVVPNDSAYEVEGKGKYRLDLYAIWAAPGSSGMLGYSMSVPGAYLPGAETFDNGTVTVDGSLKLGNNGLSSGKAQKYVVLDRGWKKGDKVPITSLIPREQDGYKFIAWFNKNPADYVEETGNGTYLLGAGSSITFGGAEGKVYSVDALWTKLSQPIEDAVNYDGKGHNLKFQLDGTTSDLPEVFLKAAPGNYSGDTSKGADKAIKKILDGTTSTYKVQDQDLTGAKAPKTFTDPGVYTYETSGSLALPGGLGNGQNAEFGAISKTLTIYPQLTLTVNKELIGADQPGAPESFDFQVTVDGGSADNVEIENGGTLTVKAGGSASIPMWFHASNTTYTVTVTEMSKGESGVTYASAQKFTVTVDSSFHITTEGIRTANNNGEKTLTFVNTYQTGTLTVQKIRAGGTKNSFPFTLHLTKDGGELVNGTFGGNKFVDGDCSFTLSAGGSKTFTLPQGVNYTVTEVSDANYESSFAGNKNSGTIGAAPETVVCTNTYTKTGSLSVTKTITGEGAYRDKGFDFTVTLSGMTETVNGQKGGMNFTENVAHFTLHDDETITATGLPTGATFKVEEAPTVGYTPSVTVDAGPSQNSRSATGNIKANGGESKVAFTNEYKSGDLTITKTVTGGNEYHQFDFTLTLPEDVDGELTLLKDGKSDPADQTIHFTNGVATFKLQSTPGDPPTGKPAGFVEGVPKSITIEGLPAGMAYTLRETPVAGYETTCSVNEADGTAGSSVTGTIQEGEKNTVNVTNTYQGGSLNITKTVKETADTRKFSITVKLNDSSVNGPRGAATFRAGEATIALEHNESALIEGLPAGARYTVTEDEAAAGELGYVVKYDKAVGTIQNGETIDVGVTNEYRPGSLTITKQVEGGILEGDDTGEYSFTVTMPDFDCDEGKEVHGIQFTNGTAHFTLKAGESITIEKLHVGTRFIVKEDKVPDGYAVEADGKDAASGYEGQLDTVTNSASVVFTNRYKTGSLTVEKKTEGEVEGHKGVFHFTVQAKVPDNTYGAAGTGMKFEGGVASFDLAGGESRTAVGLPAGVTYTVTEAPAGNGYSTKMEQASGTIQDGKEVKAVFTNTYESGSLTVRKSVVYGNQGNLAGSFSIQVQSEPTVSGHYGDMTFDTDGRATVRLSNGESATAAGLPKGTKLTVTEDAPGSYYDVSYSGGGETLNNVVTVGAGTEADVTVTNTRRTGGLKITKETTGGGADSDGVFTFKVELLDGDTPVTGTFDKIPFGADGYTFTLQCHEYKAEKTLTGLPAGVTYIVTEENADQGGYKMTAEHDSGTIKTGETATAAFINERGTGSLTINKVVAEGGNTKGTFRFQVKLDEQIDATFAASGQASKSVVFSNGVATFDIVCDASDGTETISGLPAGVGYTVTELVTEHTKGYTAAYSVEADGGRTESGAAPAQGKITEDGTDIVTVTNTYNGGTLVIEKIVSGDAASSEQKVDEFEFTVTVRPTNGEVVSGPRDGAKFDENGVATVSINIDVATNTGRAEIKGLPAGASYSVVEKSYPAYTTTSENETGFIIKDEPGTEPATAKFTNKFHNGALMVSESVVGIQTDDTFRVHVQLSTAEGAPYTEPVQLLDGGYAYSDENGAIEFELGNQEYWVAIGLPAGTKYSVSQDRYANYETTREGVDSAIEASTAQRVSLINRYLAGSLTVKKTVEGGDPAESFDFTVQAFKNGVGLDGKYGGMNFESGVARFSLSDGGEMTAHDLPAGTVYSVREDQADVLPYKTEMKNESGIIEDGKTSTAEFTNTYQTGSLTVNKVVVGARPADEEYVVMVNVFDESVSGPHGGMTFSDGVAFVTLTAGTPVTATGLPAGLRYSVAERTASPDCQTTYANQNGTVPAGGEAVVTVTNAYGTGELKVENIVGGKYGDPNKYFHFTVTLSDTTIDGKRGEMEFDHGIATFQLKDKGTLTAKDLPSGISFSVTETDAGTDGYVTTMEGNEGFIGKDTTASAIFTNTKNITDPGNGGGGGVLPPVDEPDATASPSPSPSASPSPSPNPSASPDPNATPGPGQTSQPFRTPGPGGSGNSNGSGNGNGNGGDNGARSPVTGDETAIAPWAALLGASLLGLAAVCIRRKRRG